MGLKLLKRGRVYYVRGTVKGARIFESARTGSRADAEAYRVTREKELWERRVLGVETETFAEAAIRYMQRGGEARLLPPIIKAIGDLPLAHINQTTIDVVAVDLYPDATAATRVRQVYTPILAILRASASDSYKPPLIRKPKVIHKTVAPASPEALQRVLDASPPNLRAAMLLMSYGGLRVSEATSVQWSWVNLERAEIIIPAQHVKTRRPKLIALHPVVVEAMRDLPRTDPVFGYSSRYSLYSTLRRAARRAGVPFSEISPHKSGRHLFAARLLEEGHSLYTVQQAGHWASIAVVADRYGHLERQRVHEIVRGAGRLGTGAEVDQSGDGGDGGAQKSAINRR